ncbi:MAG: UDP-N-acetylmuramoyl-L-alanyl-D-glutamate--2,6-diaminopimelate ligase [Lentisphaeria bacterium]
MNLESIITYLQSYTVLTAGPASKEVNVINFTSDSRKVENNFLFLAIKGSAFDGNLAINQAIAAGAKVIICSDPEIFEQYFLLYPHINFILYSSENGHIILAKLAELFANFPAKKLKFIGVTGTNGKTTTTTLINHIMRYCGIKTTLIGTVGYDINGKISEASHTTPDPVTLQKIFTESVIQGVDYVIMEVSSHAAVQQRIGSIFFDSLVFTNLTGDHLDYHQNMENYFLAKRLLFANHLHGSAIINTDDQWGQRLHHEFGGIEYGFKSSINKVTLNNNSSTFALQNPAIEITTPLVGKFNVANTVAAFHACCSCKLNEKQILEAITHFTAVPGRMQMVSLPQNITAFVDYAHTDDALKNVGEALLALPHKQIITVFGCGGDRDRSKRPRMANAVEQFSNTIIVTSDNPRTENPEQIFNDIKQGFKNSKSVIIEPDRALAIKLAINMANSGDLILVAGKGHENYQLINGQKLHFDDLEQIQSYI